ncbi:5'-nucleotidase /3'-nucleotidase /exopolyphosphatase [Phyllobacterium sp. YR620]|uniref:5'-nucleotidase SurE n=1 Tax=Phyllobacterium pellucidum TaxID=2740464 RepID=A0A849VSZ9_9HYPH|nr:MULTISPECIES: 5'/3'-nucleotidase SurE [Phyllobacterium]NTS31217.1 5'/3'-nucleotidase SurE [Phyllobacterium pellucidum]SDP07495.1 5'-nucleotidase /3'-nucleotidase /exopolyphosphatase [Phyllobacterium sp. YR620]
MRILLTNDDGIHAEGLSVLEGIARSLSDDIWVIAPETDQSGLAHSLTLSNPLRLRRIDERHFALRGTPTDCVIMGVKHLMPEPPDLILSGVNAGSNTADDVTYSGTIAGAIEGTLLGIRSIALSQEYGLEGDARVLPWDVVAAHAPDLLKKLLGVELPKGVLINLNFPNCNAGAVAGTRVTVQGKLSHGLAIEERHDGRGLPYYWLRYGRGKDVPAENSDVAAIRKNFISITPLQLDLTAHETRAALEDAFA